MGFLICFDVEHSGLAHAYELLRQDCECYCSEVSEETAGQRGSCINKLVSICDTQRQMPAMILDVASPSNIVFPFSKVEAIEQQILTFDLHPKSSRSLH